MPATALEIDSLFQLPLDEFTAARNSLAAQLTKAGRDEEAAHVKALARPPVSAWVVNQLYWQYRSAFNALLDAGERFRKVQATELRSASSTKPGEMKGPLEARTHSLSALVTRAATILKAGGHPSTPDVQRRIITTLEAFASYGRHPGAPAPGRLTDDVQPPGFEVLAQLGAKGATGAKGASKVIPFRQPAQARGKKKVDPKEARRQREREARAQRAAALKAIADAERVLRDARQAAARAEAALKTAAARARKADTAKAAIEQRFEKASADADAARQDARHVASAAEEAAQAVDDAERALSLLRSRRSSRPTSA